MATLLLEQGSTMIYLGARQITSNKGNLLTMVKLGDPAKFENHDFFIDPVKIDVSGFALNSRTIPTFELGIYNNRTSLNLLALTPAK